jgi:hypothetical protein
VRGGTGTALVSDPEIVAARIREYMALGIDTFILSGYPHLEEAYRFADPACAHWWRGPGPPTPVTARLDRNKARGLQAVALISTV